MWSNVFERGRLKPGEWILIHGGSSGIGTIAIQLAHVLGSHVLATAGSAEKCAACERLGAERAINYRETDFVAAVRETTGGRGVDVVLDMVGGDYLSRNIDALALEGRLVQIALQAGSTAQLNMAPLLVKRLTITASTLRARSVDEKGAVAAAVRANVWPLLESGAVKPIIHTTFPLRAAADAHRLLESSQHMTFTCLALIGATDTVSMVIRNIIRQLETPDRLRGRMSGVNMVFFMGGPQLGEFEAGEVANWLGAVFSVVSGGVGCLAATAWVALTTPALRRYHKAEPIRTRS